MTLSGLSEITRKLERLQKGGADRAMLSGARAAAKEMEAGIKDAIPGRYRSARKGIGRRVRRKAGEIVAKVGAGVGKQSPPKRQRKRPGVGLGKRNIHWAILGVQNRQTKQGQNRGRHEGFLAGVVQQGAATAEIRAALAMRQAVQKEIDKAIR